MRVFIVDDDNDHAESIADVLEQRGYDVEIAYSGEEAVERFRDADFDIVLMDMKLPGMNGVETFFEFRKIRPEAHVFMMTGYSVEQLVAQAVENGALGVLRKPFGMADLLAAVRDVKPRGMVLVADDDPLFGSSIVNLLGPLGYRVEIAATGQEAVDKLSQGGVDCLLLDVRMPILSGLEVYLRMKEAGRQVPTILITGHAGDDEAGRLGEMTQGLLVKPFDPSVLVRAMSELKLDPAA
ncbi:MAG: response regulator [Alphaproteobacteria bacterium]|nr:response regulator [Alphaproteobacteria bacterium]